MPNADRMKRGEWGTARRWWWHRTSYRQHSRRALIPLMWLPIWNCSAIVCPTSVRVWNNTKDDRTRSLGQFQCCWTVSCAPWFPWSVWVHKSKDSVIESLIWRTPSRIRWIISRMWCRDCRSKRTEWLSERKKSRISLWNGFICKEIVWVNNQLSSPWNNYNKKNKMHLNTMQCECKCVTSGIGHRICVSKSIISLINWISRYL